MAEAFSLPVDDLPDGWVPLECLIVLKCLDEDGETALALRKSKDLRVWDAATFAQAAADRYRMNLRDMFVTDEDGDGEEEENG